MEVAGDDPVDLIERSRRQFFTSSASLLGTAGLASVLQSDGLLAQDRLRKPLDPKPSEYSPKAKNCIMVFMAGAPSQIDLFDPKPKLNELDGQKLPESFTKSVRFAFIQKESATLMGSPRKFRRYGESGIEMSDLLPHLGGCADEIALVRSMHTDAFNHHPGQLLMNTGVARFGLPSMGSWLLYGLGSESANLPGYVVLTSGRGTSGGATNWSSGFLPSSYAGVLFRDRGEPVLNLGNPRGLPLPLQRKGLDALKVINQDHFQSVRDPEVQSRIAAYELAFRMQMAAPELIDFTQESKATLNAYGVDRTEGGMPSGRGGSKGTFASFSRNCLLARRLVERGCRFVSIFHASWDHHSNLDSELAFNCRMADQPMAALIDDLKNRGMLDSTLVIWASEFGRTPLGENRRGRAANTGRDHHPFGFSIWLAGGGVPGGRVIGATDEIGWHAAEDPIHVNDFHATCLHHFGLNHENLTYRFQGRDFRLTDVAGKLVKQLVL